MGITVGGRLVGVSVLAGVSSDFEAKGKIDPLRFAGSQSFL
jgi:hypothetical protein